MTSSEYFDRRCYIQLLQGGHKATFNRYVLLSAIVGMA